MNFLAHLYLSSEFNDKLIGNFIADTIRGKQILLYGEDVQAGIHLHRRIDHFTDNHPIVRESKKRLQPIFAKYAPVIVDIYYDHFLAKNWNTYSDIPLQDFAQKTYSYLNSRSEVLPPKAQYILERMELNNWLFHYQSIWGMEETFKGMAQLTSFNSGMEKAVFYLQKDYDAYEQEFTQFFPSLIAEVKASSGF